ncbi:MAG: DPP IV N-terminal domain-containing protein [Saprospiraceae bacterium]
MKKILTLVISLLCFGALIAQQKQLKIEDYANPAFRPKVLQQLQWIPNSNYYTYIDNNNLLKSNESAQLSTITSLSDLNMGLKQTDNPSELKGFPQMTWKNDSIFTFINHPSLMQFNVNSKKATVLNWWNENADHYDISNLNHVAYDVNGTLFVSSKDAKKPVLVSKGDGINIVCGTSVHRDEFGISKGTFWSPKGDQLAFYRMDQSMVSDYPMADYRPTTAAKSKLIKYPMAGAASHQVSVGIFDVKKRKTRFLQTGEPAEQYLTNLTWSPDGDIIYIQVLNRDQNWMKLNAYEVKSGKFLKTVLEEKSDKYVEPLNELTFLPNQKDQFIYQSQRDGFNHLYLYRTDGTFVRQLTSGNWIVTTLSGFSKDGKTLYFVGTKDSPLDRHTYALSISTGEIVNLTKEEGVHTVLINDSDQYLIDTWSSQNTFYKVVLNNLKTGSTKILSAQNDPFLTYNKPEISTFTLKASDGQTDLYARMIKPTNFDPNKKYPVMYYLYGGPHAQMVQNRWLAGADMFMMYMASQGYVVFTIDNRGSGNRGRDFEQATFRQLGTVEMEDQMVGINYLKNQTFVDQSKMGIFGWSFGGFMSTTIMTHQPDIFKAAVAGGPVIDWKYYEIMYTERYMDTPETNPEGYKNASLLNRVSDLKGKLLIIEGLEDGTVVPQHCYSFINECIAKGVLLDFFPYPNHEHNVRGKDRIHLYMKIEDYFKRNL